MNKKLLLNILAILLFGGVTVFAADCQIERTYSSDASCTCPEGTKKCPKDNGFYCRDICYCGRYVILDNIYSCVCEEPYTVLCENPKTGKYSCMISCINDWVPYGSSSGSSSNSSNSNSGSGSSNNSNSNNSSSSGNSSGSSRSNNSSGSSPVGGGLQNPIGIDSFSGLLDAIATWLFDIGIVLAPLMFVIGGIMLATAYGNATKVQNAKNLMLYTAIGIIVIILAKSLVEVLKGFIQ